MRASGKARSHPIAYSVAASRPWILTSPGASNVAFSAFKSRIRDSSWALNASTNFAPISCALAIDPPLGASLPRRRYSGAPRQSRSVVLLQTGFDCSGLVYAAYRSIGWKLPRSSWDQLRVGRLAGFGRLRPGDLLFTEGGGPVQLVASKNAAASP